MFVQIEMSLESQLKVTWGNGNSYGWSYSIGAAALMAAAAVVRDELETLSYWAIDRNPDTRRSNFNNLVAAGKSLYFRLFNDSKKADEIAELKLWIADEFAGGDQQLTILADPSLCIPWGLVFDDPNPSLRRPPSFAQDVQSAALFDDVELASKEIREFGKFWSLRYSLSASTQLRPRSKLTRQRKSFGLLSIVNAEVQEEIEIDLDVKVYRELCEIPPVGMAHSLARCLELIEETDRTDILLHFLGHHSNQELDLGGGEKITYDEFALLLEDIAAHAKDQRASPYGLLFLNGCDSAVGELDYGLRAAAMRSELCGVIATESKVRTNFAAAFGYRFLYAMVVEGKTVSDAMSELRHEPSLWPESLLYGCYAHPSYRIEKLATAA